MKSPLTQLIHNPGSGFDNLSKQELMSIFAEEKWDVSYASTKKDWQIKNNAEVILIAGGDGTVRKVVSKIKSWAKKPVLGILRMGTANNIASSMGIDSDIRKTLQAWRKNNFKTISYDMGIVDQPIDEGFFLESIGAGIFPHMMKEMEHNENNKSGSAEESMQTSLKTLYKTGLTYESHYAYIEIDEQVYSGLFLWIEIMNMKLMGPGLVLAADAESNDNLLNVVLVREEDRELMNAYLKSTFTDTPIPFPLSTIKTNKIKLQWYGNRIHIDDDMIRFPNSGEINVTVKKDMLHFMVP